MTCRTGECGTVHNFTIENANAGGSYSCDCGMFTMRATPKIVMSTGLWQPSEAILMNERRVKTE